MTTIPAIGPNRDIQFPQAHEDGAQFPEGSKLGESQSHFLEGLVIIERQAVGVGAILSVHPRPLVQDAYAIQQLNEAPITPMRAVVDPVHGMPKNEDEYLGDEGGARSALRASRAWITIFGHTHLQEGWYAMGKYLTLVKPNFPSRTGAVRFEVALCHDRRYLINPGSVGQPRDGDWRAAFAIYDDAELRWTWYRVPYQVGTAQRRILRAGLPEVLATRLRDGS
jgi:diadenosine tetraphosphatase ApaH/serine/threonine PP2A family protein phosphatase